jgi:hypothetical protein
VGLEKKGDTITRLTLDRSLAVPIVGGRTRTMRGWNYKQKEKKV